MKKKILVIGLLMGVNSEVCAGPNLVNIELDLTRISRTVETTAMVGLAGTWLKQNLQGKIFER